MIQVLGFICKHNRREMVTFTSDSEKGTVVLVAEHDNGQTCHMVEVSLKMEDIFALRNQLTRVIGDSS